MCIRQTDIWGETEKVRRSLKQRSVLFQDRGIICIRERAPTSQHVKIFISRANKPLPSLQPCPLLCQVSVLVFSRM